MQSACAVIIIKFSKRTKGMPNYSQKIKILKLQYRVYKIKEFNIFSLNNLHISKKSSTFAVKLKTRGNHK